jgi:NitT/TauT family transport system ATP-binding protein
MIRAESLSIEFMSNTTQKKLGALENINFKIKKGEFISLIGPSGCGKSSLLNAIAGFIPTSTGKILYKDEQINKASRERVVIFQNHSLFPWKTAIDNIAFALRARGVDKASIHSEAMRYLSLVKLEDFSNHFPSELSGGMQQRIGIARALAADPEVLLLDEPFASLDQFTRDIIQEELLKIIRPLNKTAVLVTHNINEAIFFADRLFVMSGRPGTIKAMIDVNFNKPSTMNDIENNEEFRKIKKEVNLLLNGDQK